MTDRTWKYFYVLVGLFFVYAMMILPGCSGPLAQGQQGFDLSSSQQTQLRREKAGCERMGGKFFVRVNNLSPPPTFDVICDLPNRR